MGKLTVAGAIVASALMVAACGGSGGGSSAPNTAAANTAGAVAAPAGTSGTSGASSATGAGKAAGVTVATHSGPDGTYLTNSNGRSLYLFAKDSKDKSTCSGACASVWPPLTTSGAPQAADSAKASLLGTITDSDGNKQVTYDGHPLYYYQQDTKAGQTTGQGFDNFGAKWWLVAPAGSAITSSGAGASPSSSSSSSSSGGGSWG